MTMSIIRQAILFVENPRKEDGDELLETLLQSDNTELAIACLQLLARRNIQFNPCANPLYHELTQNLRMPLLQVLIAENNGDETVMNKLLGVFPDHVINPDPSVRRELTRQWYNETRPQHLPKWKTKEEALNE